MTMHLQLYNIYFIKEYVAKFIAETKQKYTQKGGVRPFGLSTLIAGFDEKGVPHVYSTDPSGSFS